LESRAFGTHSPHGSCPGQPSTTQAAKGRKRWRLKRVRDVSKLGARRGHGSSITRDHAERTSLSRVRSQGELACKSSKRVQTGEPTQVIEPPAFSPRPDPQVGPVLYKLLSELSPIRPAPPRASAVPRLVLPSLRGIVRGAGRQPGCPARR